MTFKLRDDIPRSTTFAYRKPPRSGNEINGLGERSFRRAAHVFHNDGSDALPWDALDRLFSYVNSWRAVLYIMKNIWNLRRSTGPSAPVQRAVSDPDAMTREVKDRARALGADLVGIAMLKSGHVYEGHEVDYRYAISIGVRMNRDRMRNVPDDASAGEVMRVYARIGEIASALSEEIRAMGSPARAYGNPNSGDLLYIPIAIDEKLLSRRAAGKDVLPPRVHAGSFSVPPRDRAGRRAPRTGLGCQLEREPDALSRRSGEVDR